MIGLDSRLRRNEPILAKQVKDDLMLLDPHSGEYYTLDEVGSRVWELCDGQRTVSDIAAVLTQEYDAPAETITADVLELVKDLADGQLVVLTDR